MMFLINEGIMIELDVVSEGKDMPSMDISGYSDCYCLITCEHNHARTSTIQQNLNPFWGESFELYVILY